MRISDWSSDVCSSDLSDDKIVVGNISSISGPVPGLGATSLAGVQAYAAYRNSMGGVCGRQIEVKGADDGMDNGRYRANAEEMNGQVLGLISGITAGDAAGAEVVERNKIPVVSTRSEEHTSELQSLMRISYAVFCLQKKKKHKHR